MSGVFLTAAPGLTQGRTALLDEISRRPADPWPRGQGHVILSAPGLPEAWKAYHEPGGSFSPAFAAFGISLWVVDEQERLRTTSDTLPLAQVQQSLVWSDKKSWPPLPDLPAIATQTPYYRCTWSVAGEGQYRLNVRPLGDHRVWIMVRSPGPAGGPLRAVQFEGGRVYVNDRWILEVKGPGARVDIADPRNTDPAMDVFWPAERSWGYARIRLLPAQDYWLTVEPATQPPLHSLPSIPGRTSARIDLPDPRFAACLNAQIAHLAMGLVGNETRPGDPNNYPLNWLRDGAYTIVALARAGHLDAARELCRPFAEQDFFGGFGAEADAPGLALWALEAVAAQAHDTSLDDWLWPSVVRKVELIETMLNASEPVRQAYTGPVVPTYVGNPNLNLVCDPAEDGLIVGRMDWGRPVLFVNAVSYQGLISAARLADRRGLTGAAAEWRTRAAALRDRWNRALNGRHAAEERTRICGLHPTWVVTDPAAYTSLLTQSRTTSHNALDTLNAPPKWTYFTLAETHQWLLLGQTQKVWNDLEWFWTHEASPGLFTWWEGTGEENTFGLWEQAMGWVHPPHVTPHYWTAAEMALLQLDMLATVDESHEPPRLIIGPGLRPEWMNERLKVEGVFTRLGRVDWEWRRGRLTVQCETPEVEILPGPAFPPDLDLRVK